MEEERKLRNISKADNMRRQMEEYKLTSMPNAWRSAKSVVLGAMAKGISLMDDNFNIKGKTEVQNQLKELPVKETLQNKAHRLV